MPPARLERATYGLGIRCSILLSYEGVIASFAARSGAFSSEGPTPSFTGTRAQTMLSDLYNSCGRTCCQTLQRFGIELKSSATAKGCWLVYLPPLLESLAAMIFRVVPELCILPGVA